MGKTRSRRVVTYERVLLTFNDDILDAFLLGFGTALALAPLVLLAEFGKHQWPHGLDDARQSWVVAFQEPCIGIGGTVEVDAYFEHRVLRDPQVSSYRRHVGRWFVVRNGRDRG